MNIYLHNDIFIIYGLYFPAGIDDLQRMYDKYSIYILHRTSGMRLRRGRVDVKIFHSVCSDLLSPRAERRLLPSGKWLVIWRSAASGVNITVIAVKEQLRRRGGPRPGRKIPTELELSGSMGVGRNNSAREAVKALVGMGVPTIRRSEGTFMAEGFSARMLEPMVYGLILEAGTRWRRSPRMSRRWFRRWIRSGSARRPPRAD